MADLQKLKQATGDLDEELVIELLEKFIAENPTQEQAQEVVAACQQGMEIVGDNFEKGEYFVGDLIFAGELLTTSIDMLKPLLGDARSESRGLIVLGTVEGDVHDIGKNIFGSMAEAAGFTVVDIGIDQPPETFVNAVREHNPKIVGFSGVLTLAIDAMKRTIADLKAAGLLDGVKVIIGGNAVNQEACEYAGADAWSKNAAEAVKICGEWVS
jgi:methanogenic corrinoid protein MtbC1